MVLPLRIEKKKGKQSTSACCFYCGFLGSPISEICLWGLFIFLTQAFFSLLTAESLQIHILLRYLLRALADLLASCPNTSSGSSSTPPWLAWCHCIVMVKPWCKSTLYGLRAVTVTLQRLQHSAGTQAWFNKRSFQFQLPAILSSITVKNTFH